MKLFVDATAIVPKRMSGIGHALLQMLRELDHDTYAEKYSITLFAPYGEGAALKRHAFRHIKIRQLPYPHKVLSVLSRLQYGLPIDIFLGGGIYIFPNYRNWNLLFSKSLTFFHDISFLLMPQYVEPTNLRYLLGNIRKWLDRTDILVTISKSSKKEIKASKVYSKGTIHVVELGVDPHVFYPRSAKEINEIRKKYDLPKKYCMFVGNIEPRKNLKFLVDAYAHNEALKSSTLFLVGGDGWLNEPIYEAIDKANESGYTIRKNKSYVPDEDIPVLMSGASIVFFPSNHEGFGLPGVQAQACGTPVVTSDIAVMREIGKDAYHYFKNHSEKSFDRAVASALNEPHVKNPKVEYTWNQTVQKLLKVVAKLE